jgi:hypothetical protein
MSPGRVVTVLCASCCRSFDDLDGHHWEGGWMDTALAAMNAGASHEAPAQG